MRVFWWRPRGWRNFGDELGPLLAETLLGVDVEWAEPQDAELAVVGSIATMLPSGWAGTALGIGWPRPEGVYFDAPGRLRNARVLALRGQMSLNQYLSDAPRARTVALGDPGLLAGMFVKPGPKTSALGVVAHWQDRSLDQMGRGRFETVIDVRRPPLEVINAIARCDAIVASSLHGVIVADALGIPRKWHPFAQVQGGGFKFHDHASVVGPITPETWQTADASRVAAAKDALLVAFAEARA